MARMASDCGTLPRQMSVLSSATPTTPPLHPSQVLVSIVTDSCEEEKCGSCVVWVWLHTLPRDGRFSQSEKEERLQTFSLKGAMSPTVEIHFWLCAAVAQGLAAEHQVALKNHIIRLQACPKNRTTRWVEFEIDFTPTLFNHCLSLLRTN